MTIKVFTLNSFAKTEAGGNPAGVVIDADNLNETQMKFISGKVGFSETAFIQKSDRADFKVRFFTPTDEVDLCGHATIATYSLLWKLEKVKAGSYKQETKAGILGIEVRRDGIVFMEQNLPVFYDEIDKNEIAKCLNVNIDEFIPNLPIQIVSTGLKDIIVPLRGLDILNSIKPDFNKMKEINMKTKTVGFHVFTTETKFNSTAHCRNFAPLYGIPEESATGTSNGALACYLFRHSKLDQKSLSQLVFEQGYSMEKPSEILVNLLTVANEIKEVKVGGKAVMQKELNFDI